MLLLLYKSAEPEPAKYFLPTLPATISHRELVDTAKLRGRIERDYQDLKQELRLGTMNGEDGEAFTITAGSASPPTDS